MVRTTISSCSGEDAASTHAAWSRAASHPRRSPKPACGNCTSCHHEVVAHPTLPAGTAWVAIRRTRARSRRPQRRSHACPAIRRPATPPPRASTATPIASRRRRAPATQTASAATRAATTRRRHRRPCARAVMRRRSRPTHGRALDCATCHRPHGPSGVASVPACESCHDKTKLRA
jgi:hypothetical protein